MPSLSELQREALLAELGGLRKFCLSLTGSAADADDLLQTTVEKVLKLYRFVGFEEYHKWHDQEAGIDVWFLERKLKSADQT